MRSPFSKNSVIKLKQGPLYRILWFQEVDPWLWVFNLDKPKALPERMSKEFLFDEYAEARLFCADDPFLTLQSEEVQTISNIGPVELEERRKKREERIKDRHAIISGVVMQEPDIFLRSRRASMVGKVCEEHEITRQTVYGYLRRWWQRGCVPASLADDYSKCGAPGVSREPGTRKRGRPRKAINGTGINVTQNHLRLMRLTFGRRHIADNMVALNDAYWKHMRRHYPEYVRVTQDRFGNEKHELLDMDRTITEEQFRYHYQKENNLASRRIKKLGLRKFEQTYRPILDNSINSVAGPGSKYELDATILNVYAASRFGRNMIVGRPTLYLIIDIFSRMIVGFYVGLENPSFDTAMLSLINVVEDKVEYCASYQIEINEDEWPSMELPSVILADRGETMTHKIRTMERDLCVHVENTKPFAGEAKGLVESMNRTMPEIFESNSPGFVRPDYGERGAPDYRLEAALTIDEITRLVILAIIERNNTVRRDYPGDPRIIAEGVPFIPSELWQWGKQHLYSEGRRMNYEYVKQRLLPQVEVTVARRGLRFSKGLYYQNAEMMQQSWYFEALDTAKNKSQSLKLEAAHHPASVDVIYVTSPVDPTKVYKCELTPHCRRFMGKNYIEVDALNTKRIENEDKTKKRTTETRLDRRAQRDAIIANAIKQKSIDHDPTESNASRTGNLRQNRKFEKEQDRRRHAEETGFGIPAESYDIPEYPVVNDPDQQRAKQLIEYMDENSTNGDYHNE